MKIAVDASRLTRKDRTGTENYLFYIIKNLSQIDSTNEYTLFFKEDGLEVWNELNLENKNNFSYKVLKSAISWTHFSFAKELFLNNYNLAFCTWHTVPLVFPFWKTKIVATIHDITGKKFFTNLTINHAAKLIAVSKATKEDIAASKKTVVIYEGFDTSKFDTKSTEKEDYILFVGTVGARKNVDKMIKAYLSLGLTTKFKLAGSLQKGYELLKRYPVEFLGYVPDAKLPELYARAKLFLFAVEKEGFGVPILEAMASGTPVITSNKGAMKEIAGDAAYFVDPDSVESISDGIRAMLNNEDLMKQLTDMGYQRAKEFSWEKSARETLKIFEEVYAGSK